MLAPHIPHRIGKKVASRKKSRLRRKKHACRFFLSHEFIEFIKLLRVQNLPSLMAGLRRGLRHLPAMR